MYGFSLDHLYYRRSVYFVRRRYRLIPSLGYTITSSGRSL